MKVMIVTGGTGGHINPALALAEILKQKDPKNEVVFIGSKVRMESTVIPEKGYRFFGLDLVSMQGNLIYKAKYVLDMYQAYRQAKQILKNEKPDICIGFGNYISVPVILAAHRLHIKTMIHEQNSFAGKANKLLSRYVDGVVGCYNSNIDQMPAGNVRILGNPEATLLKDITFDTAMLKNLELQEDIPFVVFMMGSLGSSSVSKVIDEAIGMFDTDYQVIIATGKGNEYQYHSKLPENVKIVPYIDGKQALKGCALAVTRAGATTIAEICAIPASSILIPSPFVANNHQYYNAKVLEDIGGAIMIEESKLTAKSLSETINALMHDKQKLVALKQNAYQLAKIDAADKMIMWIEEIING